MIILMQPESAAGVASAAATDGDADDYYNAVSGPQSTGSGIDFQVVGDFGGAEET